MAAGLVDLEAYDQVVLDNPDFVSRLKSDAPMNESLRASFFGGGAEGYTGYPELHTVYLA